MFSILDNEWANSSTAATPRPWSTVDLFGDSATLDAGVPRTSGSCSCRAAPGRQGEDVNQARVFVDSMVQVPDLAGVDVRVRGADELPHAVIRVVADVQDGLAALEDLAGLDACGAQQPVPHPPSPPIALHDLVGHPPNERQILMGARLVRRQVRAALRHALERLVDQRERMPAL